MNAQETQLAKELERFIDELKLTHFKGREFTPYWDRAKNGVKNTVPPRQHWANIVKPLQMLNTLRTQCGSPIYLTSTYRSPKYNAQLAGAADQSRHLVFNAIDFYSEQFTPRQLHAALKKMRDGGMFKGGLGLYKTFVHIDTRGYNADWKGQGVA